MTECHQLAACDQPKITAHGSGGWKSKARSPARSRSAAGPLPGSRLALLTVLSVAGGVRALCGAPVMGALAPWVGLRLRGVSALRRAPLLTPSPAGVRVPICEFGGDTSIQTFGVSQPPNRVEPAPWGPLTAGVHRGCSARCGQWRQRLGWASWGVSGDVKPCAGGGRLLPARAPPETVRLWWSPLAPGSVLDLRTWFLSRSP